MHYESDIFWALWKYKKTDYLTLIFDSNDYVSMWKQCIKLEFLLNLNSITYAQHFYEPQIYVTMSVCLMPFSLSFGSTKGVSWWLAGFSLVPDWLQVCLFSWNFNFNVYGSEFIVQLSSQVNWTYIYSKGQPMRAQYSRQNIRWTRGPRKKQTSNLSSRYKFY